jgi:hypothetical protein
MLASWDHIGVLKPALSSINGRERRNRQLDSVRTFFPILGSLLMTCRLGDSPPASQVEAPSVVAVVVGGFDDQFDELALAQGGRPGAKVAGGRGLRGRRGRRWRVDAKVGQADPDKRGDGALWPGCQLRQRNRTLRKCTR